MATKTMPAAKAKPAQPVNRQPVNRQPNNRQPVNRQPVNRTCEVNSLEYFAEKPRVDREQGIVHGVKILGRVSKNGHRYSDQAFHDGKTIYDGAVVNLDHPPNREATAERGVRERFGVIRNPVVQITGNDETDGVYGDHHFPLANNYTAEYLETLDRFPHTIGFSHNAVVTESVKDGVVVFSSIQRARSVDLVANPATTRGVFESERYSSMDDPNLAVDPNAAAATEDAAEPTTEEQMCAALKQAVNAILDDDTMSIDEKKQKVVTLMEAHDKVTNGDSEEDDADGDSNPAKDDDGKKPADDTASLKDRLTKLEQELKARNAMEAARELLEKAGLRPVKWQVKAFSVLEGEDERKAFIDDAKKTAAVTTGGAAGAPAKPRSTSVNALESQRTAAASGNGGIIAPKTHDDLKALTSELMGV